MLRVGGSANFSDFRYQHVGIPKAKLWRWGSEPTPGPNAKGFASQWNIGLRLIGYIPINISDFQHSNKHRKQLYKTYTRLTRPVSRTPPTHANVPFHVDFFSLYLSLIFGNFVNRCTQGQVRIKPSVLLLFCF